MSSSHPASSSSQQAAVPSTPAPTPTPAPEMPSRNQVESDRYHHHISNSLAPIKNDEQSYRERAGGKSEGRMCYGMASTAFGLIELCVSIDASIKENKSIAFVKIYKIAPYVAEYLNRNRTYSIGATEREDELKALQEIVTALWLAQRHKIAHTSTVQYGALKSDLNHQNILEATSGGYIFNTLPFLRMAIDIAEWQKQRLRLAPNNHVLSFDAWMGEQKKKTEANMPLDELRKPEVIKKLTVG